MTGLKRRLDKLECTSGQHRATFIFLSILGEDETDSHHSAIVPGVGRIDRHHHECREEFVRRAYAMEAAGKALEDLTEAKKCAAYEAGDRNRVNDALRTTIRIGGA